MAEVFGAVASGIGIAGVAAQAIDGIRKLQAFCNDIRDAPEEIKYLTTELEILLGTIASIEAQIQRNSAMCGNMDPTTALHFVDQSDDGLDEDGVEEESSGVAFDEDRKVEDFVGLSGVGILDRAVPADRHEN
ncbi:hypothetical protein KCU71_g4630, partial [Aureobasidium melanogenum]